MITLRLLLSSLSAVIAVAAAGTAAAQAGGVKMRVEGAWARRAPMMSGGDSKAGTGNGAVYATLVNPGKEPDALVAASSDAAGAAEIHETYQDMGMAMMRPVKKIEVPAGKSIEMKPGSYHIMLLNLKRDLKAGQTVSVTLQFDRAGKIPVNASVK